MAPEETIMEQLSQVQADTQQVKTDVAVIKEQIVAIRETATRIEAKVNDAVFREEYERRHREILDVSHSADRKAELALQQNRDMAITARNFRAVFSAALVIIGLVIAYLHH